MRHGVPSSLRAVGLPPAHSDRRTAFDNYSFDGGHTVERAVLQAVKTNPYFRAKLSS